ncbi:methylenetetrahydrofolate reductase [Stakelama sp. CBK3Z-3]|uniref:methylenetetrahydrofolate reductase (NADH) n=2 Tax=Stakelama flava TaxID=2860338 RepID=A0ABS6XPJ0_9SPHN|nr:methylenetetrahydrofolate reductase [Stakelama flava]MBW4332135.1 methylenetetrahydrofolate reductase [Stakelama flava]
MIDSGDAPRADLLSGFSFEISAKDAMRLEAIRPIVPDGTVVSITYLPNESDEARIAAAAQLRALGLTPMPHVAARRVASADTLQRFLDGLSCGAGVERLFVIAGDLAQPAGPFADARALISAVDPARHGIRTVGIAGYPEGHPAISRERLDQARRDKIADLSGSGVEIEILTQFAFDGAPIVDWLRDIRADGFGGMVRVGLPGPANVGTLLRFAARCGVGASAKVMAKYGTSLAKLFNTAGPDLLYAELAREIDPAVLGPVTVHLYPFGGLQKMAEWAAAGAAIAR